MKTRSCSRKRTKSRAEASTPTTAPAPPSKKTKIQKKDNSGTKRPKVAIKKSSRQVRLPLPPTKDSHPCPSIAVGLRKEKEEPRPPIEYQKDAGLSHQCESKIEAPDGKVGVKNKQDITLTTDLIDASNILALVKLGKASTLPAFQSENVPLENPSEDDAGILLQLYKNGANHVLSTMSQRSENAGFLLKGTVNETTEKEVKHASMASETTIPAPIVGDENQIVEITKNKNDCKSSPDIWLPIVAAAQPPIAGRCGCGCGAAYHPLPNPPPTQVVALKAATPLSQQSNPMNQSSGKDTILPNSIGSMCDKKKSPLPPPLVPDATLPVLRPRMLQHAFYAGPYALPPPYPPQCLFCHSGYYPILNHPDYYAGSVLPPPPPPALLQQQQQQQQPVIEVSKRKINAKRSRILSIHELRKRKSMMVDVPKKVAPKDAPRTIAKIENSGPPNGLPPVPPPGAIIAPIVFPKKTSESRFKRWTKAEDEMLLKACETVPKDREHNWSRIAREVFGGVRSAVQCKSRWHNMIRPGRKVGAWTKDEDDVIIQMKQEGKSWEEIAERLPNRRLNHVRERWITTLDPSNNYGPWTDEEMKILLEAQSRLGNTWMEIAKLLPGRSVAAVKNRFYNIQTSKQREGRRLAVETLMRWEWQRRRQPSSQPPVPKKDDGKAPPASTVQEKKKATAATTPSTDTDHSEDSQPKSALSSSPSKKNQPKEQSVDLVEVQLCSSSVVIDASIPLKERSTQKL